MVEDGIMPHQQKPLCVECGKEIFAIAKIYYVMGVELPSLMHYVCYERLKEYEYMYKGLCK